MPGVWARTSLITTSAPPGISVKCTFVVSPEETRGSEQARLSTRTRGPVTGSSRASGAKLFFKLTSSHSGEWRVRSNPAPRDDELARAHGHIST